VTSLDARFDPQASREPLRLLACLPAFVGLAAVAGAAILERSRTYSNDSWIALQLLLVFVVSVSLAIAIKTRPNSFRLLLACATCLLARTGIPHEWDSIRLLAGFGAIVAGVGAILAALPMRYRKIGASILVILHFGAIATAVTSSDPQPWLSNIVGVGVFRPYLDFMNLQSSYGYYSPEPGPSMQLWVCVKYQPDRNGVTSARWFKMPNKSRDTSDPFGLTYHRRAGLAYYATGDVLPAVISDSMKVSRLSSKVPIHPEIEFESQYRLPPNSIRSQLLPSYARHVARFTEIQHDDGVTQINSIQLYGVEHFILPPADWKAGIQPYDPATYRPYYLGEFDTEGRLMDPDNPLLYWLIPIYWKPIDDNKPPVHMPWTHPEEYRLVDGLRLQTGADHNLSE
jgi:hypothetical protein